MTQGRNSNARMVDPMKELDHIEVRDSPSDILAGPRLGCKRCNKGITTLDNGDTMSVLVALALAHNRTECRT